MEIRTLSARPAGQKICLAGRLPVSTRRCGLWSAACYLTLLPSAGAVSLGVFSGRDRAKLRGAVEGALAQS
jgi:hypothetical protein